MRHRSALLWSAGAAGVIAAWSGAARGAPAATSVCQSHVCGAHAEVSCAGDVGDAHATSLLDPSIPDALVSHDGVTQRTLAELLFPAMPAEHQAMIAAAGGFGPTEPRGSGVGVISVGVDAADPVLDVITPAMAAKFSDVHLNMIRTIRERSQAGLPVPALCFAPGTDPDLIWAVSAAIYGAGDRFQQTNRWANTASGPTGTQGTPITLRYSFVPDGTFCPNIIGVTGNSQLFQWLNGRYGNFNTWKALFDQVFARWSALIGVDYVYEPNDDGVNLNQNAGVIGVRGDVRIAAIQIDGNFNTLAYNNFPNDGDMVLDAFDSFYNSTSNNSRALRNVIAHEHGHGLGMLHVCPQNSTKLMEPSASTNFDGPQLDDILNGQRHYGDPAEPNDSISQFTDVGNFTVGSTFFRNIISIDDDTDVDYFRINATTPLTLNFAVAPDASTYSQGPQTAFCNTGTSTNYNAQLNLVVQIRGAADQVLQTTDNTLVGSAETGSFGISTPGVYYVRVSGTGANSIQRYFVSLTTGGPPFTPISLALTTPAPTNIDADTAATFDFTVSPNSESLVGTPELLVSVDGGLYDSILTTPLGSNTFRATIPASECGSVLRYYLSAEGSASGTTTLPEDGAAGAFLAYVGDRSNVFADSFETDLGWTISGSNFTPATGQWQRGTPVDTGALAPDFDADGSGQAYLTGNFAGFAFDVDGAETVLTSPLFDATTDPDTSLVYSRWYDNGGGGLTGTDTMIVEISDTGGLSWSELEVVGPTGPDIGAGWVRKQFRLADLGISGNQIRIRFRVGDTAPDSTIEAGVDAVAIQVADCEPPVDCPADLTGDGQVDSGDLSAFVVAFLSSDPSADLTGDGQVDSGDLGAFITLFLAGCP
jgi:hypothetical protein